MNLYIGNLSPETSEADLRKTFSEFGEVVSTKVLIDPETGMPRGFGFVEMGNRFQAQDAILNLDSTYLQGTIITVKEAKPKGSGGPGGDRNQRPGGGGGRPSFSPRERFNKRY